MSVESVVGPGPAGSPVRSARATKAAGSAGAAGAMEGER